MHKADPMARMNVNKFLQEHRKVVRHSTDFLMLGLRPHIICADGLKLSIQASKAHYCRPRSNVGPYTAVEVGFPSKRVEELMPYIDGPDEEATTTVYGYVPVEVVEQVIEKHGGVAEIVPLEEG